MLRDDTCVDQGAPNVLECGARLLDLGQHFVDPGTSFEGGYVIHRERKHGYVYEVPSQAMTAVEPRPIRAMGRFEH